jgi:hypothetical protein
MPLPLGQKTAPTLRHHLCFLMRSPYSTPPPPFPTQLFPLALRTLALLPPTPSLLLNHRTIQTAKIPPHPALCAITPSPILADSGATHVLLRESVLPSLAHLMHPATLPPMPFTLPNGSLLTAQSGGHLHFHRLPFPVPFWSAPDTILSHSLLSISPLLQTSGSCLLIPTSLSIFAPGDPTPVFVDSKQADENVWRLHIPSPPPPQPPPHPVPLISAFFINPTTGYSTYLQP